MPNYNISYDVNIDGTYNPSYFNRLSNNISGIVTLDGKLILVTADKMLSSHDINILGYKSFNWGKDILFGHRLSVQEPPSDDNFDHWFYYFREIYGVMSHNDLIPVFKSTLKFSTENYMGSLISNQKFSISYQETMTRL